MSERHLCSWDILRVKILKEQSQRSALTSKRKKLSWITRLLLSRFGTPQAKKSIIQLDTLSTGEQIAALFVSTSLERIHLKIWRSGKKDFWSTLVQATQTISLLSWWEINATKPKKDKYPRRQLKLGAKKTAISLILRLQLCKTHKLTRLSSRWLNKRLKTRQQTRCRCQTQSVAWVAISSLTQGAAARRVRINGRKDANVDKFNHLFFAIICLLP